MERPASRALPKAGSSNEIRIAMIAMTTSNSMSVNARRINRVYSALQVGSHGPAELVDERGPEAGGGVCNELHAVGVAFDNDVVAVFERHEFLAVKDKCRSGLGARVVDADEFDFDVAVRSYDDGTERE